MPRLSLRCELGLKAVVALLEDDDVAVSAGACLEVEVDLLNVRGDLLPSADRIAIEDSRLRLRKR